MVNFSDIEDLIIKYLKKELTAEEQTALDQWIAASVKNKELFEKLNDRKILEGKLQAFHRLEAGKEAARKGLVTSKVRRMFPLRRVAAAVAVILMLGIGGYFYFNKKAGKQIAKIETQQQRFKNDVAPGKYKAKLTLVDGSTIVLDSASVGQLAKQGKTVVLNKDGQLVYDGTASQSLQEGKELLYNMLSTAKGETYATVLADGSKVWLNSGSSIKFPVAFVGNDRQVEIISGEAYFEVAHDATKPFNVTVNGMNVQVLGTHFNINAYDDEATIKTTLLEGSVKITKGTKTSLLTPGKQAVVNKEGDIKIIDADINEVIAWKEGRFYFNGADIKTIMQQLSRWYDVEINYQADINYSFVAKIRRDVPVSELLKLLELTDGVHFKIDGKRIIVMK